MLAASTVNRATSLLSVLSWVWTVVTGIMLSLSFKWSAEDREFNTARSWMALGLAIAGSSR